MGSDGHKTPIEPWCEPHLRRRATMQQLPFCFRSLFFWFPWLSLSVSLFKSSHSKSFSQQDGISSVISFSVTQSRFLVSRWVFPTSTSCHDPFAASTPPCSRPVRRPMDAVSREEDSQEETALLPFWICQVVLYRYISPCVSIAIFRLVCLSPSSWASGIFQWRRVLESLMEF